MNVQTGYLATAKDLDAMSASERSQYEPVPARLQLDARAHYERGESVYAVAPRSALARFGKKAMRDKTRANKAARKNRHR